MSEPEIDKGTGLPIVEGKIDLSNGIPRDPVFWAAFNASVEELKAKTAEAELRLGAVPPELHEVARALHTLRTALPLLASAAAVTGVAVIPLAIVTPLLTAAEAAAIAIGI